MRGPRRRESASSMSLQKASRPTAPGAPAVWNSGGFEHVPCSAIAKWAHDCKTACVLRVCSASRHAAAVHNGQEADGSKPQQHACLRCLCGCPQPLPPAVAALAGFDEATAAAPPVGDAARAWSCAAKVTSARTCIKQMQQQEQ